MVGVLLGQNLPGRFLPEEDVGYFFMIQLPPAVSQYDLQRFLFCHVEAMGRPPFNALAGKTSFGVVRGPAPALS